MQNTRLTLGQPPPQSGELLLLHLGVLLQLVSHLQWRLPIRTPAPAHRLLWFSLAMQALEQLQQFCSNLGDIGAGR